MVVYVRRRARLRGRKAHTSSQSEQNTVRSTRDTVGQEDGSRDDVRLPHDRDGLGDAAPEQSRRSVSRAARDIADGRADTEARNAALEHYRRVHEGKRGG